MTAIANHETESEGARAEGAEPFWSLDESALFAALGTGPDGLSEAEAARRAAHKRPALPGGGRLRSRWALLGSQFKSPITLLMLFGACLSMFLGDLAEGAILLAIVAMAGALGFWQEKRAADTLARLFGMLQVRVTVRREGRMSEVPLDAIVPGDVVVLEAGSALPGDGRILAARGLFVDESALTGESFPVEKRPGPSAAEAPLPSRAGSVFLGTHVVSGAATAVIAEVGERTAFGEMSRGLARPAPETAFERGTRRFGYLLLEFGMALSILIFAGNLAFRRPLLDSLLFTLALAVGLTPQLLPAIQGITLARGAGRMAKRETLVRRLSAIEDIGGMEILCTDKTGTLTRGVAGLEAAEDPYGAASPKLGLYADLNASLQSGYANPIDAMLRSRPAPGAGDYAKQDEIPYDFSRKLLSVAVEGPEGTVLITKGALDRVLAACDWAEAADGRVVPLEQARAGIRRRAEELGLRGCRCLGVAWRKLDGSAAPQEAGMAFLGILAFRDPLKPDAAESLAAVRDLGISVKMITGDNRVVAARIAAEAGLRPDRLLTGEEMGRLNAAGLARRAARTDVFAEMDPGQKERIIIALKAHGRSVGYMGDGINDAAVLHAADVGISVEGAADVTQQAADIVLLRKDLKVLAEGVREGRRAFANTLKYVFITSSANLGNMVSMAGASLCASFLPMLPKQILFLNLLSDLPAMAIASDRLDPEMVGRPRRWDNREIQRFMIVFGLISSCFDFLTFGALLLLRTPPAVFRTAWFLESLLSEVLVLLIIRTRRWSFRSRPGGALTALSLGVALFSCALPWLPGAGWMGFAPLPGTVAGMLAGILAAYCLASEAAKRPFYARVRARSRARAAEREDGKAIPVPKWQRGTRPRPAGGRIRAERRPGAWPGSCRS
jgi:Mg2+-importing ATPase